jgi:acyl carrier protein
MDETRPKIVQRLVPLFRDVLDDHRFTVDETSRAETMPGYDSLAHINVISAIEQEFGVRFEFSELLGLERVGDMVSLIVAKTKVAA